MEDGRRRAEVRRQRTEVRGQRSEDRGQRTEDRGIVISRFIGRCGSVLLLLVNR